MSRLPDYSTCSLNEDGVIKHGIQWKGKFDPIAVCDEWRDANRICDALNGHLDASWGWIPVADRLPDEDIAVLVLTKSENIHQAVLVDGKWHVSDQAPGQRLSSSCITHWIDPIYPNP